MMPASGIAAIGPASDEKVINEPTWLMTSEFKSIHAETPRAVDKHVSSRGERLLTLANRTSKIAQFSSSVDEHSPLAGERQRTAHQC
jgi:hypothetical protein